MKIKNYRMNNKYISLKGDCIEIPDTGVTIIKGGNGAGKSTFIKDLIFGVHDIEFSDSLYKNLYKKNRERLFFYVSQHIPNPEINVKDYLHISTRQNFQKTLDLLNEFNLNSEILYNNVNKLSGGERAKLNLVLALQKECPYIILDEPTNNLDNRTVDTLLSKIKEMGKYISIIISTHDIRLFNIADVTILIENGIIGSATSETSLSVHPKKIEVVEDISRIKDLTHFITKYLGKNKYNLLLRSVVMCSFILLTIFTHLYFDINYSVKESQKSDSIIAYLVDYAYSDLNKQYVESEKLTIPDSSRYNMIKYSDIKKIASQKAVNAVYILDERVLDNLQQLDTSDTNRNNLNSILVTIPELISNNYMDIAGLADYFALKSGRYPKDYAKEIVISANKVSKISSENSIDECIGKEIAIEGTNYKIVGVSIGDISLVSYGEKYNNLFYEYNTTDCETFAKHSITFKKLKDYVNVFEANNVVISVAPGQEQNVLNNLIKEFPATNYYSYEFENSWRHRHNTIILGIFFLCNIVVLTIIMVLLNIILGNSIKNDIELIRFSICYYLDFKKVKGLFITISMVYMLLFLLITLLISKKLLHISIFVEFGILIGNALTILGFILIKYYKEMKKIQI